MIRSAQRSLSLLVSFLFLLSISQAQNVEEKQMSLVVKKTATWCSNCGSWGWQWFKDLIDETEGDAFSIALHSTSSQLKPPNNLDGAILAHFTGNGGFPTFFVNGVSGSSYSGLVNAVDAASGQAPVAGIGMITGYENDVLSVQGKVEFFQPFEGEIFVGYYIIEDSLVHSQTAQGANAIHRYVLLDALEGKPFGNSMTVDVQSGQTLVFPATQPYAGLAVDRSSILGVIWTFDNGKYSYLNSWLESVVEGPLSSVSAMDDLFSGSQIFPNPASAGSSLRISLPAGLEGSLDLEILHQDGRIIDQQVRLIQEHQISMTVPKTILPGTYFVRLRQGTAMHTFPLSVTR